MKEKKYLILILFASLTCSSVLGQSDSIILKNNSLFIVDERDTLLKLENVDQVGIPFKTVIPFVRNSYIGLLDSNFNIIMPPTYHVCGSDLEFREGLLKVSNGDKGVTYLDNSGKEIITLGHLCSCCFENNWATSFSNGYVISYNGNWFVTDTSGRSLKIKGMDFIFSMSLQKHFEGSSFNGVVHFKTSDNYHGVIVNGKIGIPPIYSDIKLYQSDSPGIWAQCKNDNQETSYYIDASRNIIDSFVKKQPVLTKPKTN